MMTFLDNPTKVAAYKKLLHSETLDLKNVVNITALDKVEQKTSFYNTKCHCFEIFRHHPLLYFYPRSKFLS